MDEPAWAPTQANLQHIDSMSSRLQLLGYRSITAAAAVADPASPQRQTKEGKVSASCSEADKVSAVADRKWSCHMPLSNDKSDH